MKRVLIQHETASLQGMQNYALRPSGWCKVAMLLICLTLGRAQLPAQGCSVEAEFTVTVVGNTMVFQPVLAQNIAWEYAWGWEYSNSTTGDQPGYSLTLPIPNLPETMTVRLGTKTPTDIALCVYEIELKYDCQAEAGFEAIQKGCCTYFDPNTAENVTSVTWNFGDGSLESNEIDPMHCYANSGVYSVSHAVVFGDVENSYLLHVHFCEEEVLSLCLEDYSSDEVPDCCRLQVCFQSEIQTGQHQWQFGDGTTSTEINPCHYYTNLSTLQPPNGTPTVTVTHTVTINGVPNTHTHDVTFSNQAIYLGAPGAVTFLNTVVSSINNAPIPPLQSSTLSLTPVHIAGELRVNKPWTCNGVKFCMDPAAGMRVTNTNSLNFGVFPLGNLKTQVNTAPECFIWRSIDMEAHTNFTSTQATIKNALYGLRTLGINSTVRLTRTKFQNNFIGMYLRHNIALPVFNENEFSTFGFILPIGSLTVDPAIPAPYLQQRGFAGIYCRANTLNIPLNGIANPPNLFNNLANGIWTENTNATLRRCKFTNMTAGAYGNLGGVGIRYNDGTGGHFLRQTGLPSGLLSFSNCRIGISVSNGGPNTLVDSRNNVMNPVGIGYDLAIAGSLANGSIIDDNDITATGTHGIGLFINSALPSHLDIWDNFIEITNAGIGIWLLDNNNTTIHDIFVHSQEPFNGGGIELGSNAIAGIALENFDGAEVVNNEINIDQSGVFPRGIVLTNSDNNTVGCNNVTGGYLNPNNGDSSWGLRAVNSASNTYHSNDLFNCRNGINFDLVCGGTTLRCNRMQTNNIGLHYTQSATSGPQDEMGNRWLGNWVGNTGALHEGMVNLSFPINDILSSRYWAAPFTNEFPPSIVMPNNSEPSETWFYNGDLVDCGETDCDDEIVQKGLDVLDSLIASGGIELNGYEDVYRWLGDRYLYKKLKVWLNLANGNTLMQNYLNSQATDALGKFWEVGSQTASFFGFDANQDSLLASNFTATQQALDSIDIIDEQLAAGVPPATEIALLADRENWLAIIDDKMASNEGVWTSWMGIRTTEADISSTFNNGVTTAGDYDDNEKVLNEVFLQTVAKGLPVLLAQKNQIKAIAEQCALEGGDAVYRARAWYVQLTGVLLTEEDCIPSGGRSSGAAATVPEAVEGLRLYPNPASQKLNIAYQAGTGQWLVLFNQLGLEIRRLPLQEAHNELDVDLSGLPPGIYFIKVQGSTESDLIAKFVIQK